jgi:periplasmic protein TonB
MDINKILKADILDIIFDGRNKEYGAYELRKGYSKRLWMALLFTVLFTLLMFGTMKLSQFFAELNANKNYKVKDVELTEVKEDKKVEEIKPPPPPPKVEPPKIEVTKFTPPKIVKDEEVKPDEKPPEQDKLDDTKIGSFNQEGIKDNTVAPPVEEKGTGVAPAPVVKDDDADKIFTKVEREAEFPGGDAGWKRYLEKNLNANTPIDNGAPEGTYTVVIKFVVDKEGKISDVEPLSSHGFGMEQEAMKIIKKGPNWKPAEQNGRQVRAYRSQPITFVVQGE